jgi:archaellum component FlaC
MDTEAKTVAGKMLKTLSENIGSDLFRTLSQKADSLRKKTGDLGENIESLIREYAPVLNKKKED